VNEQARTFFPKKQLRRWLELEGEEGGEKVKEGRSRPAGGALCEMRLQLPVARGASFLPPLLETSWRGACTFGTSQLRGSASLSRSIDPRREMGGKGDASAKEESLARPRSLSTSSFALSSRRLRPRKGALAAAARCLSLGRDDVRKPIKKVIPRRNSSSPRRR